MCEPTTLTALSTMAGNFGFQQTAATFATMAGSSTAVAIGQGISAVTSVISSPITSMGLSLMQGQATKTFMVNKLHKIDINNNNILMK